jgi:hypothetical protein
VQDVKKKPKGEFEKCKHFMFEVKSVSFINNNVSCSTQFFMCNLFFSLNALGEDVTNRHQQISNCRQYFLPDLIHPCLSQ